jgi:hypothetical protein
LDNFLFMAHVPSIAGFVAIEPMESAAPSYKPRLPAPIGTPGSSRHADSVKSGSGIVSLALVLVATLATSDVGRVDETPREIPLVSGFEFSRPEAQVCSQTATLEARELVFETVEAGDLDADEIRRIAAGEREVVKFKWNPATGELTYDTSSPTGVFSDLVSSSRTSDLARPICESH